MRKKFCICVIAGFLLRLVFMPVAFHGDLLWINAFVSKLALEGVFDIYGFIEKQYPVMLQQGVNYYPPLSYFLLGGFHLFFKWVAPGLGVWLSDAMNMFICIQHAGSEQYRLLFQQLLGIPFMKLGFYITLMKIPYALFDILCLILLLIVVKPLKSQLRTFRLWMINPVVIFGSYIFGQFDILVAFFLLLTFYLLSKKKIYWGFFTLGAAVLLKPSPIILILPMSMLIGKGFKQCTRLILTALIPLVMIMGPLYLSSGNYALSSLFPRLLTTAGANKLDTIEFTIGKLIFISGYMYILYLLWQKKNLSSDSAYEVWRYMLSLILLSYFVVYTPIHYFEWVIPLFIIGLVNKSIPPSVYFLQVACLFVYALNSRPLGARLFLPLQQEALYNMKSIPEFMNQYMSWGLIMRTARLIFHCCSLYIIWKLIFKPEVIEHA